MAVQGSLKTITIPELFSLLHQLRKTGVLTLVTSSDERSFVLYKGNIVYAMARDGSRRMGSYLVRLGLLTQEELNSQLARRTAADVYIGQRLVESGQRYRVEKRWHNGNRYGLRFVDPGHDPRGRDVAGDRP